MIEAIFNHGSEVVIARVSGHKVEVGSTIYGAQMATIDGLKLDFNGTIREFPDLKEDLNWREKAIERFKEHIKTLKTEDEIMDYLILELRTKGYLPKLKQKQGHRPVRII